MVSAAACVLSATNPNTCSPTWSVSGGCPAPAPGPRQRATTGGDGGRGRAPASGADPGPPHLERLRWVPGRGAGPAVEVDQRRELPRLPADDRDHQRGAGPPGPGRRPRPAARPPPAPE